jgi:hypothetical protein
VIDTASADAPGTTSRTFAPGDTVELPDLAMIVAISPRVVAPRL